MTGSRVISGHPKTISDNSQLRSAAIVNPSDFLLSTHNLAVERAVVYLFPRRYRCISSHIADSSLALLEYGIITA